MSGFIELEKANVRWYLAIDKDDLPPQAVEAGKPTYRSITVEEIEFSGGFTDLHTLMYQTILDGNGFGVEDVRPSIELVSRLRAIDIVSKPDEIHPYMMKHLV